MAHNRTLSSRNVTVLSIGAGTFPRHENVLSGIGRFHNTKSSNRTDWGIGQYSPVLLDLLLDGDSVTIDLVMHYLLDKEGLYHRFDPQLPWEVALDDTTAMKVIILLIVYMSRSL